MADNFVLNAGAGGSTLATDEIPVTLEHVQFVKLMDGTANSVAKIAGDATNGLDVDVTRMAALVANSGVDIGDVTVNNAGGASAVPIQDGGNSITVDNAQLSVVGGGTEAAAMRVTLASDSTGVLSVDDNGSTLSIDDGGGAITVDGTVAVSGAVDTELTTADLDTGVGTDTRAVVGLVGSASGGGALIPGSATDGLLVNLGANNDVTVTGTVTANAGSGTLAVSLASVPSHAVTNAGTFATQVDGAALTALQLIDDPVQVLGTDVYTEASSKGVTIGAVRRDADTTLVSLTNEFGPLQMDANGRLKVEAFSGETLPVSGTVTANLAAGTNNIGDVDILSIAAGDNNIGNVDVVTLPALPAGTNNIGDVDVLSVIPGTGATDLGKAIDAVAGATDTGVAVLAVRDDALAALTPIEGDYVPLRVNSTGALHVTGGGGGTQYAVDGVAGATDTGTLLLAVRDDSLAALTPIDGDYTQLRVNSTGALHVTGGGGGTEYVVDAAAPAAPTGATFVMERDDALSALTEIEGDWTNPRANANGALWVKNDGTMVVDGSAVTQPVSLASVPSHAVTNAGTFATQVDGAALTALQLIDDPVQVLGTDVYTEATSKGVTIGAVRRDADTTLVSLTNEFGPLQMDANGRLKVEAFSGETLPVSLASVPSHAVTNAGTFATQVDGAALTALQLIDDASVAHDAAAVAGVRQIGLEARTADPTAVATGDATRALSTTLGKQVVYPFAIPASTWQYAGVASGITDTADDVIIAAVASTRHYLTNLLVVNGHATVSTEVVVKDGATVIHRGWAQAVGGGYSIAFNPPLRGTANTALNVANITTGSATRVSASGFSATE